MLEGTLSILFYTLPRWRWPLNSQAMSWFSFCLKFSSERMLAVSRHHFPLGKAFNFKQELFCDFQLLAWIRGLVLEIRPFFFYPGTAVFQLLQSWHFQRKLLCWWLGSFFVVGGRGAVGSLPFFPLGGSSTPPSPPPTPPPTPSPAATIKNAPGVCVCGGDYSCLRATV